MAVVDVEVKAAIPNVDDRVVSFSITSKICQSAQLPIDTNSKSYAGITTLVDPLWNSLFPIADVEITTETTLCCPS